MTDSKGSTQLLDHHSTIEKLDGTNYRTWSFDMEMTLKMNDLWDIISEDQDEDGKKKPAAWIKKDQKVFGMIVLSVKTTEKNALRSCKTAKEAWNCLETMYSGKQVHRLLEKLNELTNLQLKQFTTMSEYARTIRCTMDELAEVDMELTDTAQKAYILNGLPIEYRSLINSLESQLKQLNIDELVARLLSEERAFKEAGQPSGTTMVFAATVRKGPPECWACGEKGHVRRFCPKLVEENGTTDTKKPPVTIPKFRDPTTRTSESETPVPFFARDRS